MKKKIIAALVAVVALFGANAVSAYANGIVFPVIPGCEIEYNSHLESERTP